MPPLEFEPYCGVKLLPYKINLPQVSIGKKNFYESNEQNFKNQKIKFFSKTVELISTVKIYRRKKTSLRESLAESHAYNPIWDSGETIGEREKSRQKSCRESLQDSQWNFWRDSRRDFSRSPSVSPESRIGLYAWLSARLSFRLVFLRGVLDILKAHNYSLVAHNDISKTADTQMNRGLPGVESGQPF